MWSRTFAKVLKFYVKRYQKKAGSGFWLPAAQSTHPSIQYGPGVEIYKLLPELHAFWGPAPLPSSHLVATSIPTHAGPPLDPLWTQTCCQDPYRHMQHSEMPQSDINYVVTCKISHRNREISILTIKKRQTKVNTSSTSHRDSQRKKDKTENRGQRNKNNMNAVWTTVPVSHLFRNHQQ